MTQPPEPAKLVQRFQRNLDVYTRPDCKKARAEFIDPFFELLGYAEQDKDVVHEDALTDKQLHQRQIDATDRQIDRLAYELYELAPVAKTLRVSENP